MDYLKVQTDMLKKLYKGKSKIFLYLKEKDYIWAGVDGVVEYHIPKDKFYLSTEKYSEAKILKGHIDKIKKGKTPTKVTKFENHNKPINLCVEFSTDSFKAYIDYNLLKPFENKKTTLSFTVLSPIDAVSVWEEEELLGFIMPFRYNAETEKQNEVNYYE